jgi:lactoylglutathione lyase
VKIEHIALWTRDLEGMRTFYVETFGCTHGIRYVNPKTGFSSYFLSFSSGARLEIMSRPDVASPSSPATCGYAHFALSLGSEEAVREWTEKLGAKNVPVTSAPRRTGDGYYESVIADPEGNLIELTT